MLDIAIAQASDSPQQLFGCFAFRSYDQAEQKASEFIGEDPEDNRAVVIKSFNAIYRDFCKQQGEQPIDREEADESTLSSYLTEIRKRQPRVFELLENYRATFCQE